MAELVFYSGPMDSGKSTLALQMDYSRRNSYGLLFTKNSRGGTGLIESRLGIEARATEVTDKTDFYREVSYHHMSNPQYVIVDEAQFLSPRQIDQLAWIVDDLRVDVFAFGLLTDFRTELFPGSKRLVELSDRIETVQADTRCWCGKKASVNARVDNGKVVLDGDQVMVGDTGSTYKVLCREHWRRGLGSR